jgi:hypothetical protein
MYKYLSGDYLGGHHLWKEKDEKKAVPVPREAVEQESSPELSQVGARLLYP